MLSCEVFVKLNNTMVNSENGQYFGNKSEFPKMTSKTDNVEKTNIEERKSTQLPRYGAVKFAVFNSNASKN